MTIPVTLNSEMENEEFISHVRQLRSILTTNKAACETEMESVSARLRELNKKLAAIDILLDGTAELLSGPAIPAPPQEAVAAEGSGPELDKDDMTEFVRDLTRGTDTYGIRPRDVTKALTESGRNMSAQYASNALYRLKKRGEVVEYQGRYYWPGFEPPSARIDQVRPEDVFPLVNDAAGQQPAKKEWDF